MNKSIYRKLAINNIRKNKSTYLPFGLAGGTMTALFYMLISIRNQVAVTAFVGGSDMKIILNLGVWVCGIFSVLVIFYTNGFLLKRRNKELGLYNVLGMEKRHIGKVLFWEIILAGFGSMIGGLLGGLLFAKLMFLVLLNMLHLNTGFEFGISFDAAAVTLGLFTLIFIVTILYNNLRLIRLKPIELLQESNAGEREPRAKWVLAILGVICLSAGYYLAITTQNPIEALFVFFIAVLLVIAGTFLLFISGSIAFLKILKKNKGYYYHKTHFITVSGMMYRMKQNAVGLAAICILSTAVLVVLSTTVSLYVGIDDVMRTRYPSDVITNYIYEPEEDAKNGMEYDYDPSLIAETIRDHAMKYDVQMEDIQGHYSIGTVGKINEGRFTPDYYGLDSKVFLYAITLADYNSAVGENAGLMPLDNDHIYLFSISPEFASMDSIAITDEVFRVDPASSDMELDEVWAKRLGIYADSIFVVVSDFDELVLMQTGINDAKSSDDMGITSVMYNYEFNLEGNLSDKEEFSRTLRAALNEADIPHVATVENIFTPRQKFIELYGSLFFIGIFIGAIFLMATAMIIYYKQISEGYEDRSRFVIMQNVGMSREEVKRVIKNQIRTVFYLPIILAIVHIAFAFNIILKLLAMLNLTNVTLFIGCTLGTILVFVIIYWIVYKLTARSYYQLVHS